KSALRIGSPSKLMRDYGQWTSEGLALGIEDRLRRVGEASTRMANAAVPTMAPSPAGAMAASGSGGSGVTINQTVNPAAGMNEKQLGIASMRRMAFAMRRYSRWPSYDPTRTLRVLKYTTLLYPLVTVFVLGLWTTMELCGRWSTLKGGTPRRPLRLPPTVHMPTVRG